MERIYTFFSIYLKAKGIQEDWIPHFKDLANQVNSYKDSIKLGHNVIVVAHSQGNYYTNESYELLADWMKPYFHMMGVATPANHVAGDGPYVLFDNDFINLVVTGLSPNRTDTRHHGFPSVDAHDFYESYLQETTTRKDIQNFIINQVIEHEKAPSQWETNQEYGLNTCEYKITVKHRYDSSIEMPLDVYPFNGSKKLYQVNGEWVKASCGGENILEQWDGKKDNECLMIDNPQEEKIIKEFPQYKVRIGGSVQSYMRIGGTTYIYRSVVIGLTYLVDDSFYEENTVPLDFLKLCQDLIPTHVSNYDFVDNFFKDTISNFKNGLLDNNVLEVKNFKISSEIYNDDTCGVYESIINMKDTDYTISFNARIKDIYLFYNKYDDYSPWIETCINESCSETIW